MTKARAIKLLQRSREILDYHRQAYVDAYRDTSKAVTFHSDFLEITEGYKNIREKRIAESIEGMKYAKEKISRYQRIAL